MVKNDVSKMKHNHSTEIGHIIGAIKDIPNQTKILALNASIQSARAGKLHKQLNDNQEIFQVVKRLNDAVNGLQVVIERLTKD